VGINENIIWRRQGLDLEDTITECDQVVADCIKIGSPGEMLVQKLLELNISFLV